MVNIDLTPFAWTFYFNTRMVDTKSSLYGYYFLLHFARQDLLPSAVATDLTSVFGPLSFTP